MYQKVQVTTGMQHLNLFYIFITLVVGILSFGIGVVEYLNTREPLVRYYLYFHLSLSVMVLSDLALTYVAINLPELPAYVPGGLNYLRVFIADNAIMVTFPVLIHEFFAVPYARQRNIFFVVLVLVLAVGEHLFTFVYPMTSGVILWDNIEDLTQMLTFFYGFVMGITMLGHLQNQRRKRLARHIMILLGIAMPTIVVDTLLFEGSVHFYPLAYCAAGLVFTYHQVKYSLLHPQEIQHNQPQPSASTNGLRETVATSRLSGVIDPDGESDATKTLLGAELYQRYNISPREQDVLPLLVQGASNKELSERLFISVSTVKTHLRNIYAKFNVKNRYELLALLKHGDEALLPRSDDSV